MRRVAVYFALWCAVVGIVLWRREDGLPIGRFRWYLVVLTTLLFMVALADAGY